jgi:hypothetical protein
MEPSKPETNSPSIENSVSNPVPAGQPSDPAILPAPPAPPVPPVPPKKRGRLGLTIIIALILAALSALAWYVYPHFANAPSSDNPSSKATASPSPSPAVAAGELDPNHNYGDKYANGLLPVGDNQYTTAAAQKGKIYLCRTNFVPAGQAGAQARGPWFTNNTQWDMNKKAHIAGSVNWTPSMTDSITGATRTITTNDLPNHPTGVFPVAASDPAGQYDRNPNAIKAQSLTYSLAANPTPGNPNCMGGEAGVMLTGVALFNAFDAGGRDAGAWEVQDGCGGHPQNQSEYHYHTLSSCIKDQSVSTVLGFALDGFPITGPKVGDKNILTTADLDDCHGITSTVTLDGKPVKTYHYVMTQDFPYSVSCFRAAAIRAPGLPE